MLQLTRQCAATTVKALHSVNVGEAAATETSVNLSSVVAFTGCIFIGLLHCGLFPILIIVLWALLFAPELVKQFIYVLMRFI